jgi:hypothetical protein
MRLYKYGILELHMTGISLRVDSLKKFIALQGNNKGKVGHFDAFLFAAPL